MTNGTPAPPPATLEEQVTHLLASPAPLQQWLTEDCGDVAGLTKSARLCPLATFLSNRLPREHMPSVYSKTVVLYGPDDVLGPTDEYALPAWAGAFVQAVDTIGVFLYPVLRDEALALLDKVDPDALTTAEL